MITKSNHYTIYSASPSQREKSLSITGFRCWKVTYPIKLPQSTVSKIQVHFLNVILLLHAIKIFLTKNFEIKNLGDTSFVLVIQIYRDRSHDILELSQKSYIKRVFARFGMKDCHPKYTPITEGNRFSLSILDLSYNPIQKQIDFKKKLASNSLICLVSNYMI